ncbi:MAG TPA: hypothetical protein VGV59_06680, partial [Pyrinomonadaceae bacterium]|nr:hypothetical protein [Pyrinomonadaceae bacterium]
MHEQTTKTNQTNAAANDRADAVNAPDGGSKDATDPRSVHRSATLIDMHADTVQFMLDEGFDINTRRADTHLDAERAREGGLDAQFFSIWVEPQYFG